MGVDVSVEIIGDKIFFDKEEVAVITTCKSSLMGRFKDYLDGFDPDYSEENDRLSERISDLEDDYDELIESLREVIRRYETDIEYEFDLLKWKLKHKLITEKIREKGDFDLKDINKKVEEYGETKK